MCHILRPCACAEPCARRGLLCCAAARARTLQVDISVDLGGSDSQRLLAFNLRPTKPAGKVMVTDARGRLLYINKDMHEMLGFSAQVRAARACAWQAEAAQLAGVAVGFMRKMLASKVMKGR